MKTTEVTNTPNIITNLKKSQTLIGKIITMLEEDKYCVDIMQQNLAVMGLLKSAHQMLMGDHLHTCFKHAMESPDEDKKSQMIDEILKVTNLANRK